MKFMRSLLNLIHRIRWSSVFGVIALILFVILLISFNPFAPGYKGTGDIRIRSWAEPGSINIKGKSIIHVDIKNFGDENIRVNATLSSRTEKLLFKDGRKRISRTLILGRGESRKPEFEIRANATDPGTYGIDIRVSYGYQLVEDEVYLKLSE